MKKNNYYIIIYTDDIIHHPYEWVITKTLSMALYYVIDDIYDNYEYDEEIVIFNDKGEQIPFKGKFDFSKYINSIADAIDEGKIKNNNPYILWGEQKNFLEAKKEAFKKINNIEEEIKIQKEVLLQKELLLQKQEEEKTKKNNWEITQLTKYKKVFESCVKHKYEYKNIQSALSKAGFKFIKKSGEIISSDKPIYNEEFHSSLYFNYNIYTQEITCGIYY